MKKKPVQKKFTKKVDEANKILKDLDKLSNRHSVPVEVKELEEMERLGEVKFTKISEERNKVMMDIMNDIDLEK
jgi:hypothetical protein